MTQLRDWPVLLGSVALLVGMGLGTAFGASIWLGALVAGLGLAAFGVLVSMLKHATWLVVPIIGLLIVLGIGRAWLAVTNDHILVQAVELHEARAVIVSSPEDLGSRQRAYADVTIDCNTVGTPRHGGVKEACQTVRLRLTWPTTSETPKYGQVVMITGTALPPRTDGDFNERGFLLAHHASGTAQAEALTPTDDFAGSPILGMLHTVRSTLLTRLERALAPPELGVIGGIVLGERSGFTESIEQAFRATGTTHILVVSGSNVVIVAGILSGILLWLGAWKRVAVVTLFLLGFIVITGADASVVRATVFYECILLAGLTGRRVHGLTLAAFVALLMVLQTPWILLFDIAFQLSFAAILGLMLFEEWFKAVIPVWFWPAGFAPTLAAQLTTLPIILWHFGQVSVIAPLANVVIGPIVPALMCAGAATIALPWFRLIVLATEGATDLLIRWVTWLASWPASSVALPAGNWIAIGLSLALIIGLLFLQTWQRSRLLRMEVAHGDE